MHKLIIFTILIFSHISVFGQSNSDSFWSNSRVALLGSYEPFAGGIGFIVKGKKEFFNSKHFDGLVGLAFQFSRQSETDKFLVGIDGYNHDIGIYIVSDIIYYPFSSKKIFTGLEPFIGLTNLKTEGELIIPNYDIVEQYSNSYTYVNYGITPTIGYDFGKIDVGAFAMISAKGLLDSGRTRPGDSDSKIFFGISIGYKL